MHAHADFTAAIPHSPSVVAFVQRDRTRALVRTAFPRRRARVIVARTPLAFEAAFRDALVDAALVDVVAPPATQSEEGWRAAALAREFPSVPFFALLPLRTSDAPALAQCAALDFSDALVDGVDDVAMRDLVARESFTARFARSLREPPDVLALNSPLQRIAWRLVVSEGGRPVRTEAVARTLRVTREHLSRSFAARGGPNLKRVIDLVRLIAAAELAKNPGYDLRDVARVLRFASSSHLSMTAQRIVGTKPASLSRLRTADLIGRFMRGHERSRA